MPTFTRRSVAISLAALAAPSLARANAGAAAPRDWRLSKETDWPDFARRFDEMGTQGTLVMLDARVGGRLVANTQRAQAGFHPNASFKIPNSLIALHLAAAKDIDDEQFKWSGNRHLVDGAPILPPACDAHLTLRAAFRNSCDPVFQELARRIGPEGYKEWLTKLDYGNLESGGAPVDEFWLKGDLRISADQQAKFLRKLVIKTLPVSPRAIALTEELLFIEKIGDTAIHGETGVAFAGKPTVGWWVGYVQRGEDVAILALNLDMTRPEHADARYALIKEAVQRAGLL